MPRDYKVYFEDILSSIHKIETYIEDIFIEDLPSDEKTFDAVIRNLEVIGEAVKSIPEDIKGQHPDIEWKKIAGLRDILIHEYFGVDQDIILDVIKNKIPELSEKIKILLKE